MATDEQGVGYARECERLAGLAADNQDLRDQLLQMARNWMAEAMHERYKDAVARKPASPKQSRNRIPRLRPPSTPQHKERNHAEEALMPAGVWMFIVQVLAGIMMLVLALIAVNTYVDWCHAYKAGRALDEWRVAIVRAGWCEAAGEVLPRRA